MLSSSFYTRVAHKRHAACYVGIAPSSLKLYPRAARKSQACYICGMAPSSSKLYPRVAHKRYATLEGLFPPPNLTLSTEAESALEDPEDTTSLENWEWCDVPAQPLLRLLRLPKCACTRGSACNRVCNRCVFRVYMRVLLHKLVERTS